MPQKILYFRTTIKILPVLVRLVVADKPLFTVTGNGPLRHAQKLRKVTVIQQGLPVRTTRVYYTIMKITCRIQKNESIFLHNILIHKEI